MGYVARCSEEGNVHRVDLARFPVTMPFWAISQPLSASANLHIHLFRYLPVFPLMNHLETTSPYSPRTSAVAKLHSLKTSSIGCVPEPRPSESRTLPILFASCATVCETSTGRQRVLIPELWYDMCSLRVPIFIFSLQGRLEANPRFMETIAS